MDACLNISSVIRYYALTFKWIAHEPFTTIFIFPHAYGLATDNDLLRIIFNCVRNNTMAGIYPA
jgi:hypothetical protein